MGAALLRGCGLGDRGPALTDVPRIALQGGCAELQPHPRGARAAPSSRSLLPSAWPDPLCGPDIPFLCIGLGPRSVSQLVATQLSGPDFPEFHFLYVGSFLCFLRILDVLCVFWIHRPCGLAYVFTLLAACCLRHREAFHWMWSVLLSSCVHPLLQVIPPPVTSSPIARFCISFVFLVLIPCVSLSTE